VLINLVKIQLLFVLDSPAEIALRKGYCLAGASLGRVCLQILCRRCRTLHISLLPGVVGTSRVFNALDQESIWVFSLGWLPLEHSTLLYWNLPLHYTSLLSAQVRTRYVPIALTCPRNCTLVRSPSQKGVWVETLPEPAYVLPRLCSHWHTLCRIVRCTYHKSYVM